MTDEQLFSINFSLSQVHNAHIMGYAFAIVGGEMIGDPDEESMIHPLYIDFKQALARIKMYDPNLFSEVDLIEQLHRRFDLGLPLEHADRCFFLTYSTDPFMFWWNIAAVTSAGTIDIAYKLNKSGSPRKVRIDIQSVEKALTRFVTSYELMLSMAQRLA